MYCAAADVGLLLQVTFEDGLTPSDPSLTQANNIIDRMAARIDLTLSGAGVTLPVTDPLKLSYLNSINAMGAAGFIGMAFGKNFENVNSGQAEFYWRNFLKELDGLKTNFGGVSPGVGVASSSGGDKPWRNQVDW